MRNFIDERGFTSELSARSNTLEVDCDTTFLGPVVASNLTASIASSQHQLWVDLSGNDTTGDGTPTRPYRTVKKAIAIASASFREFNTMIAVRVGSGRFVEDTPLVVPAYVNVYGVGFWTTKVGSSNVGTDIFQLDGACSKVENMSVRGISSGSTEAAVRITHPHTTYIDAPRLQNVVLRNCKYGVYIASGSSLVAFDAKCWEDWHCWEFDNATLIETYNCYGYQLDDDVRAPGSIGFKMVAASRDQYAYLYNFNTWNNETAYYCAGTNAANGGLLYTMNALDEASDVMLSVGDASMADFANVWSKDTLTYDVEQRSTDAVVLMRNAQMNFDKFSFATGGEANVSLNGSDEDHPDVVRVRGNEPAYQLRNILNDVATGGLWRLALKSNHLCFERNTHVSGAFATFSEDFTIDLTGSVSVGDLPHWNKLDVSGSVGVRNQGEVRFYEAAAAGSQYNALRSPASMPVNVTYTFPTAAPVSGSYLSTDDTGQLYWTTNIITSGVNKQDDFGIYAGKSGDALQFKALVAGSNITLSSGSNTITIDASASGEANTASNLQPDFGLFASKSGVDLRFKALVAGTNITLASSSNTITIDAAATGEVNTASNLQSDFGLFASKSGVDLRFKALVAGTNVTLTSGSNTITIDASAAGEVNTASNLQADFGLFASKVGQDLRFKALVAGSNITLSSGSNTITIDAAAAGESNIGQNLQSDFGLYSGKSGVYLQFKALTGSTGITLTSASNVVTIASEVATGSNVGNHAELFKQKISDGTTGTLVFRTIEAPSASIGDVLKITTTTNTIQLAKKCMRDVVVLEEDFTSNTSAGALNWSVSTNGIGALVGPSNVGIDTAPLANAAGVFELRTGTLTSGRAAISSYVSAFRTDYFEKAINEWRLSLQALSTAAQEYRVYFGWIDTVASVADQVDGIYFLYDRLSYGDFWVARTSTNSVRSTTITAIPVTAATSFDRFTIIHSGSALAQFYINDALVATLSTSLPSGTGRATGYGAKIEKTAGTTSRSVYADYFQMNAHWHSGSR